MFRIARTSLCAARSFASGPIRLAKNDASTIDSFRLPSQTSINEWEFKYDFMPKVVEPKIPPVSPEAVKQDIAQTKKQQVEQEMFHKELNSSVKVEANDATVVHGGESVTEEPEYLHDRGSKPVDFSNTRANEIKKPSDTIKYSQSSLNPDINKPEVVNLGHDNIVDHKTGDVEVPPEIHDAESAPVEPKASSVSPGVIAGLLGLGGVAGYFLFREPEGAKKKAA